MPARPDTPRILRTAAAATLGGFVAALLHIPLPWMIGALAATATLAWNGHAAVPPWARPAALIVLGLGFGQTFDGPVLAALLASLPAILGAGVLSILVGLAVTPLFRRMARTDARTGFFCSVPGGVIVMAVLAQRAGASVPTVTLAQTMRVLVVVLIFPPLLAIAAPQDGSSLFTAPRLPFDGAGLGLLLAAGIVTAFLVRLTGIANPWMMGPCVLAIGLSAGGWLPSGVPLDLVNAAQVAMGASLGLRMTREFIMGARRLVLAALATAMLLSALLTGVAVVLAWWAELPVAAVVLGMAPGGMPEMAVTAKALDLAVPLVLSFHLARTVLCNLILAPLWRLLAALGFGR